jgi:hypothetical protein
MASGRFADYLGMGDIADRPATPVLLSYMVGLWYSTDTLEWSAWNGSAWLEDIMAGGSGSGIVETIVAGTGISVDATDPANPIVSATGAGSGTLTIITEAGTSTMDPATHAGTNRYIRAADDVTFDVAEGYAAGQPYNLRATAGLTLIGTGVTLTPPAGGTLDLDAAMSITVVMTSSSAGDVIGQTVPA